MPLLSAGDSVVVVRGDLRNLTGRVVALNPGGTFTLQPSAESAEQLGLNERLELSLFLDSLAAKKRVADQASAAVAAGEAVALGEHKAAGAGKK